MNYDCHLEVCSLTSPDCVDHHLRLLKPSGVVFVQKGADQRSRIEWLSRLDLNQGAFGVAIINGYDLHQGFDGLTARGTCGALLQSLGGETHERSQDEILRLHEALPRTWRIELDAPWTLAAKLAPYLARMDRTFCLAPGAIRADMAEHLIRQILWWFDMGNVYLKLTGTQMEECPRSFNQLVCRHTPERIVLGSGQPRADADCWWSYVDFLSSGQADENAQRLYPFFLSTAHQ